MAKKLRRIVLGENDISPQARANAMKKYGSLSESQAISLAGEIGMSFWTEEFRLRIKEGETVLGKMTFDDGKDHIGWLRITKENGEILFNAEDWSRALGLTKEETEEGLTEVKQQCVYLKPDKYFCHPLSEIKNIDGEEKFNIWFTTSLSINILRGTDKEGNPASTEKFLKSLLFQSNPTLNIEYLIAKIKTHHVPSMMTVCNAIANIDFKKLMDKGDQ